MMSEDARKCEEKFRANQALADRIEKDLPEDDGWVCVVRFYAALHLVNAFLIDKGNVDFDTASAEHMQRRRAMERCPELRDAPHKYRALKDLSEYVRYDAAFVCLPRHKADAKQLLAKIVAIIEPKLQRRKDPS